MKYIDIDPGDKDIVETFVQNYPVAFAYISKITTHKVSGRWILKTTEGIVYSCQSLHTWVHPTLQELDRDIKRDDPNDVLYFSKLADKKLPRNYKGSSDAIKT